MKNKPVYLALLIILCSCSINENIEYVKYNDKYENDGVYNYVLLEDNTYGVHSVINEKVKMSIPDFYNTPIRYHLPYTLRQAQSHLPKVLPLLKASACRPPQTLCHRHFAEQDFLPHSHIPMYIPLRSL